MKLLHYCKVLLFSLPLNILVHNKNKLYITPQHTRTNRLLCECELYTPIYDDDPEMKKVLHDFDRQTSQRFKEYNERMQEKLKKCKEQCDKDIQKIILKDKIEKQMVDKFSALETNIDSNDIPTCICKKTLADKVEKSCLKCTQNLGGIVTPSSVVLGGIAELGLSAWKTTALKVAIEAAKEAGAAKGLAKVQAMGFANFFEGMKSGFCIKELDIKLLKAVFIQQKRENFTKLAHSIYVQYNNKCGLAVAKNSYHTCNFGKALKCTELCSQANCSNEATIADGVNKILSTAKSAAANETANVIASETAAIEATKKGAIETTCMNCHTAIIASIVAIVIIVMVMVIIYLILR
ncbi:rifin [Plasmodium falciparum NF54]|uniref:Rifin n=2 Tax=Plasmodium falciparum TaxID=5833 RepID=Q8I3D6_PLAF7|nr:rifin [Plasmodium falciparum 3D7]KAF4330708.1 rifin [Plasmodium falciparum NF54]PKC45021.1 rifin [Plasmodium falciparum NF54]CAD51697.1 rifin [Plasmodium falciparum 3D7]|eukprot:XP_001351886.1 rifin [Plasmodium falciparum 3D7]